MRNYQPKNKNPYILPHNLYMRVLYIVKDYKRLREEQQNIINEAPALTNMPKGNRVSDPTGEKVIRLDKISGEVKAIDGAIDSIPPEYRRGVLRNINGGDWFPIDADPRTYRRWKQRFLFEVAKNLGFV